jgi:DNA-binding transcriptional MerR regulator
MSAVAQRVSGLTIGTVLTVLKSEFPTISISKIRFLETEGLVDPQRARSGYRLFSAEDVERLKLILTAQRDAYLPLKVIAEKLNDGTLAQVLEQSAADATEPPRLRAVADSTETSVDDAAVVPMDKLPSKSVTESQLQRLTGLSSETLGRIRSAELITADKIGRYAPESVAICQAASSLMKYGIDERHWGPFRAAASREAGGVERAVAHKTDPSERAQAADEVVEAITALHCWLLRAALPKS